MNLMNISPLSSWRPEPHQAEVNFVRHRMENDGRVCFTLPDSSKDFVAFNVSPCKPVEVDGWAVHRITLMHSKILKA